VPGNIQSIERAAAILRLLSGRARRLGVVDLSGELGLSKGTVHGLLRTLQHVGFVEQDPETGKYQLGAALLHMGSSYLDGNELRTRALNWSDSLAARTQEAVRIGTLHEGQVLIVHHVFRPDDSLQTLDVGSLLPVHATALGKVLLAHHPYLLDDMAADGGLTSFTDATICDRERLTRELQRVRERGWASDIGELSPGQVSLAAPIMDRTGITVGSMGIFGPPERLLVARQPRGELLAYVREAARAVSRELGAIPW
jgi:DNA-binding IclR family transcriptional regulator